MAKAEDFLNAELGSQSAEDFLSSSLSADDFLNDALKEPSALGKMASAAFEPIAKVAKKLGDFGAEGLTEPNKPIEGLSTVADAIDNAPGAIGSSVAEKMAKMGYPNAGVVAGTILGAPAMALDTVRPPATTGEAGLQAGVLGAATAAGPLLEAAKGATVGRVADEVGKAFETETAALPGEPLSGGASSSIESEQASHWLDKAIAEQQPADRAAREAAGAARAAEGLKPREQELIGQLDKALDESIDQGLSARKMQSEAAAAAKAIKPTAEAIQQATSMREGAFREINAAQKALDDFDKVNPPENLKYKALSDERGALERGVEKAKEKARQLQAWGKALQSEYDKLPKVSPVVGQAVDRAAETQAAQDSAKADLLDELGRIQKQMDEAKKLGTARDEALTEGQRRLKEEFEPALLGQKAELRAAVDDAGLQEPIAHPRDSSAFPHPPGSAVERVTDRAVRIGSRAINVNRLYDEDAAQIISGLGDQPEFQAGIVQQGREPVPVALSQKRGAALKYTKEEFAKLRPGQMPRRGRPDEYVAAAAAMQDSAGKDLAAVVKLRAAGVPMDQIADRVAINVRAIVGAQGVIAEQGRALGAIRKIGTDMSRLQARMAQRIIRDKLLENPAALDGFLKEIAQLPSDAIAQRILAAKKLVANDPTLLSKFQELRAAMLLTNPTTYLRNFTGNTFAAMSNLVERPLAGAVDFAASQLTGTVQERTLGQAMANAYGMWSAVPDAAADALNVFWNERSFSHFAADEVSQGAIQGAAGRMIRLPFRVLNATDAFFKDVLGYAELRRSAYTQAVSEGLAGPARAARVQALISNPTEEMIDGALKTAREYTFQSDLPKSLAKFQQALNQKDGVGLVGKFVIPFFKTPANIGRFIIERTPVISELSRNGAVATAFLREGMTKGQFADNVAKNIVGMTALSSAALALHASEGRITGAPPKDKGEMDTLYQTGWRPYSVKVGDQYISYRGFEPVASYLAAVADWSKIMREQPDDSALQKAGHITASAVRNFVNQPFLTNLRDLLDVLDDPERRSVSSALRNQVASIIPQGAVAGQRGLDKTLRDPETIVEAMMAKTPWLSERVRPKLTKWGEPIARTTYAFGLLDKPMPPFDPIEQELRSLNIPHVVGFPQTTFNGRQLNKDDYNEMLQKLGELTRPRLEQIMENQSYKTLEPTKKAYFIRETVDQIRSMITPIYSAKAEFQGLGLDTNPIVKKMSPEELGAFGKSIFAMPDYRFMDNSQKKAAVRERLRELEKSRR